jgi:hypothetical protein
VRFQYNSVAVVRVNRRIKTPLFKQVYGIPLYSIGGEIDRSTYTKVIRSLHNNSNKEITNKINHPIRQNLKIEFNGY